MKRFGLLVVLALVAGAVHAFPGFEPVYFPAEVKAVQADLGARPLGDLKVSELVPVAERLNIAWQKDEYLVKTAQMSFAWPGAGQFATGHWTSGAVQTGLNLGIMAGTFVWANAVLPSDLRLGTMDYLGTSMTSIHNAWGAHTLYDFFPTVGVLALGGIADFALRAWSAHDARQLAQTYVDAGKITFEPRFDLEHLGFGMNMGMKY